MNKLVIFLLALISVGAIIFFAVQSGRQSGVSDIARPADGESAGASGTNGSQADGAEAVLIDIEKSMVRWSSKRIVGTSNHNGVVPIKQGSFKISGDSITGGDFLIDMTALSVSDEAGGERLAGHLKSGDFFDVGQYPEAGLSIRNIEQADGGANRFNVVADLTIKGITNEVVFPAEISKDGTAISADASFSIDRTRWDVKYGSGSFFDDLGDRAIDDMINFDVHVET